MHRHSVAQDAQLGTVKGAMVRGDKGGCVVGRALCVIACLQGCVLFFCFVPVSWACFECVLRVRAWDWSCPTVSILVWM